MLLTTDGHGGHAVEQAATTRLLPGRPPVPRVDLGAVGVTPDPEEWASGTDYSHASKAFADVVLPDAPYLLTILAGASTVIGGAAVGVLVGSRIEYRRRAERAALLRQLMEADFQVTPRSSDG